MKFSANLGFLWSELSLPEAIFAAKAAGFDAVECHWPYDTAFEDVKGALEETGLNMLGLNTLRGNVEAGENGLSAVPGREIEAREAIDQALTYAAQIGAGAVHVMAGKTEDVAARQCFIANLTYALKQAQGQTILIEPLNAFDASGYFLKDTDQARAIIDEIDNPSLKLMFDCYHVGRTEGDVTGKLAQHLAVVGHIQFASVPDRAAPDQGTLDYDPIFGAIAAHGWTAPLGAEYKPNGATEDTLGWMKRWTAS
ncbi:MAG: TIM barrel protein [Aliishimia sp.]